MLFISSWCKGAGAGEPTKESMQTAAHPSCPASVFGKFEGCLYFTLRPRMRLPISLILR